MRASIPTRTDDFPAKCGFMPIASPVWLICSHNCSPDAGAHFRYSPGAEYTRSALSATWLASAARSSPELTRKPIDENWLGIVCGNHEDHEEIEELEEKYLSLRALRSSSCPSWLKDADWNFGRGGEQLLQLVVDLAERHRHAVHLERRAVLADVAAPDLEAGLLHLLVRAAVDQVQLGNRRAAEAVHHQRDFIALLERRRRLAAVRGRLLVRQDRVDDFVGDLVGADERLARPARLAVDADAHFH